MLVEVTERDIAHGVCKDGFQCPIARALVRYIGKEVHVTAQSVDIKLFQLYQGGPSIPLPISARRFIARFDKGKPVKLFRFKIALEEYCS